MEFTPDYKIIKESNGVIEKVELLSFSLTKEECQMLVYPPVSKMMEPNSAAERREQILAMLPATAQQIELALGYSVGGSFTQIRNLMRWGMIENRNGTYYLIAHRKPLFKTKGIN
jgi:hypothetical protein